MVADADHLDAARRQAQRGMRADVAEALDDRGRVRRRDVQGVERAKGEESDAVTGRLAPPQRAAGADRLAGDDLRHGDALIHRIGVHEPGHHLLVGAHVRRHDVRARPDERDHLLHVAATEVLELLGLERARVDRDAALAAAEGKIGERAFPAHPDGERGDFADVDVGGEARAALGGAERQMMLHPVADEDLSPIVLHADRTGDDDRALRIEQPVALVLGDAQMVANDRELIAGHFEHRAGKEAAHIISPARSRLRTTMIAAAEPEELKFAPDRRKGERSRPR